MSVSGEVPDRPRLATVWLGGCSGCHMSFLDVDEFLIELAQQVDLVFSPLIDTKGYPEEVDFCFIEGAVANVDHLKMVHKIRQRTKTVISFGDCAVTGNVTAIRNQLGPANADMVLRRAYIETADVNQQIPGEPDIVPALLARVMPVHEVIHVEYYLPGCPPSAGRIRSFVSQVLAGEEPQMTGEDIKFG